MSAGIFACHNCRGWRAGSVNSGCSEWRLGLLLNVLNMQDSPHNTESFSPKVNCAEVAHFSHLDCQPPVFAVNFEVTGLRQEN